MRRRYLDAMSLVQKYGKSDIFLTMTCNPAWKEIQCNLKYHEKPQDRPDLLARPQFKLLNPDSYDKVVCAELPDRLHEDSYPYYRRRDDGKKVKVRRFTLDNRWVVPYNPYLLALFDCHMNVEICSTIKLVKYLYKYVFKGHDQVSFRIMTDDSATDTDEIKEFQKGRYISPPEAFWRIYEFRLNEMTPSVYTLQVHLPNQQLVSFRKLRFVAVVSKS
nr:uncharacterized protein LOC113732586 [Coffea arabica]